MRTPEGEGQEGVRSATDSELRGREHESRSLGTNAGYRNPGATPNLRGVQPNTAMTNGFPCDAPAGKSAGTMSSGELDIGGTGFGSPQDRAEDPGAHPELLPESP